MVSLFSEELRKEWEFYEKESAETKDQQARQANEQTKNRFQAFFGQHFTPDSIDNDVVEIDGIRLRYKFHCGDNAWKVWGVCPKCAKNTWSTPVANKRSVEAMIYGNFQPDDDHICDPVCNPASVGDRLVSLIQLIVREEKSKS